MLEQAGLDGWSQYHPFDFMDIFEISSRNSRLSAALAINPPSEAGRCFARSRARRPVITLLRPEIKPDSTGFRPAVPGPELLSACRYATFKTAGLADHQSCCALCGVGSP